MKIVVVSEVMARFIVGSIGFVAAAWMVAGLRVLNAVCGWSAAYTPFLFPILGAFGYYLLQVRLNRGRWKRAAERDLDALEAYALAKALLAFVLGLALALLFPGWLEGDWWGREVPVLLFGVPSICLALMLLVRPGYFSRDR